jgi:hypothetical protein
MKTLFRLLLLPLALALLFTQCEKDDPLSLVDIPDRAFLHALIEAGVDTNLDGIISEEEALEVFSLDIHNIGISNLTGIEAFVNLDSLDCSRNKITSLDLSKNAEIKNLNCEANRLRHLDISSNTALTYLNCGGTSCCGDNELKELDLSNCIALKYLNCNENQLSNLDVSNCTSLTELFFCYNFITSINLSNNTALLVLNCGSNRFTSLNISTNIALKSLICYDNQLIQLDISNNSNLDFLYISDMPTLHEVCVWSIPFPSEGLNVIKVGSPNVFFTTQCSEQGY